MLGPLFIEQDLPQASDIAIYDERIVGGVAGDGTAELFLIHAVESKKRK